MSITKSTLALAAILIGNVTITSAQTNFDAVADFSKTNNPAGAWSYGYSGAFGSFTLFTNTTSWLGGMMSWGRNLPYPDAYPRIGKNDTGGLVVSGGAVFTNGQLVLAPGPSPDAVYAIVRFTAPTTGLYNVGASFVGAEGSPGTTTDVHVLANGIPYFNGTISGYGNGTSFTSPFPFTLNAGDTLDFVCGDGGNGFQGDSTGFAATVTFLRGGSRVLLFPAVELGWATESGESYQVQWATQLQTNDWNDLGAPVAGDGALHYMFDSTRGQPQRFYRVVTTE